MKSRSTTLARALRAFFAEHLPAVRGVSPHTVCSYRDAFTVWNSPGFVDTPRAW